MSNWLDTWRAKSLESAGLTFSATTATIEAEYALAMHKQEQFGKSAPIPPPAPQPQAPATQQAAEQSQPVPGDTVCVQCGAKIMGFISSKGNDITAEWLAKKSIEEHGKVLCKKCQPRKSN